MDDQEMKRRAQYDYDHRHDNDLAGLTMQASPMQPKKQSEIESHHEILANLLRRFDYHAPNASQLPKYQNLRDAAKAFATVIVRNCPEYTQETQSALQGIEAVLMIANKSIALNDR